MTEAYVKSTLEDGIAVIEFFHPQSNSLPGHILTAIADEITAAGKDSSVTAVVLRSGGDRVFCAGASFDELVAIENKEQGLEFFSGFAKVINAIRVCPKFVIGRVQGKAVGGGVGVASATDYCFATKFASIKLSELAVGIGPFVVGPAVERKVGTSAFGELSIAASDWRDAQWAKQKGLFADVYDNAEEMDEAIATLINKIKTYNPEAMAEMKKVLWKGTEDWDTLLSERAVISGTLVLSDFTRNAINKFKSKS